MGVGFYFNFSLKKIEDYASSHGFSGPTWKDDVLRDLLYDGKIHVCRGVDPKDQSRTVWRCVGRNLVAECALDRRPDALFCIGLKPRSYFRAGFSNVFAAPGPWRLDTVNKRDPPPITLNDHLSRCEAVGPALLPQLGEAPMNESFQVLAKLVVEDQLRPPEPTPGAAMDEPDRGDEPALATAHEAPALIGGLQREVDDDSTSAPRPGDESGWEHEFPDGSRPAEIRSQSWQKAAQAAVELVAPETEGLLEAETVGDARRQRIARLEAELERLRAELQQVPSEARLMAAADLVRCIVDAASVVLDEPPASLHVRGPVHLLKVLNALGSDVHEALPPWALGGDHVLEPEVVLGSSEAQDRLLEGALWVRDKFGGVPPLALRNLAAPTSPPGEPTTLPDQLDAAWASEAAFIRHVKNLPDDVVGVLRTIPGDEAERVARALEGWRLLLHPDAFGELVALIRAGDPPGGWRCPDAPSMQHLDSAYTESLTYIQSWGVAYKLVVKGSAKDEGLLVVRSTRASPSTAQVVEFGHVVTDDQGRIVSPTILALEPAKNASYALVEIPIRIYATRPIEHDRTFTVRAPVFVGVPANAILGPGLQLESEGGTLRVRWTLEGDETRWRPVEGSNRYAREEKICLAITRGTGAKLRDRTSVLSVTLRSDDDVSSTLRFDHLEAEVPPVLVRKATENGDASSSDLVRKRPLGPQVLHRKLEGVVEDTRHSFMVVAPRRFGKTTLLQHLLAHAQEAGHQVVYVTLSREESPAQAASGVWRELLGTLAREYDARPSVNEVPDEWLDLDAWTKVRRFIHERGKSKLVLLIDEAQALVPRAGSRWGTDLKNFIERHLASPDPVTVQIGLFGTVDLGVRIGQNCKDFLIAHGAEQFSFDEASLARYLREVGQGVIQSSKAARIELVHWANNLHTLLELFNLVRAKLHAEGRLFMLDVDVQGAVRNLLDPKDPSSSRVWEYTRSELSHHDEWEPVDGLPLALAWSLSDPALPAQERLSWCVGWMNKQLTKAGVQGEVPPERADTALRDLRARGVLRDDGGFYRPLLERLLRRQDRLLLDDVKSRLALLRLAVDVVEWPADAEPKGQGGQASVYLAEQGGRPRAFRVCALDSEPTRRRFARTCAALKRVRDHRTRIDGDEHLPRLSQAGFRADNGSVGVVVYDWVEGVPLEQEWEKLDQDARVHVVKQVVRAVDALHRRDVIHCDIAPRNIIVDGSLRAVLIDFGLAQLADAATQTRLGSGPFKAPEQCADPPRSSPASDVYALGVLLRGPAQSSQALDPELSKLVESMTSADSASRPAIAAVLAALESWDYQPQKRAHENLVEDVISDLPEWLWEDLLAFKPNITSMLGSGLAWNDHRAMTIADLLNRVFVHIIDRQKGKVASFLASLSPDMELSLAALRHVLNEQGPVSDDLKPWASREVHAVGILRNAYAHPRTREKKILEARRALSSNAEDKLASFKRAVLRVAALLDELVPDGKAGLTRLAELAVGQEANR